MSKSNSYLEKVAMLHKRHRYVDDFSRVNKMEDPVGTIKYDGANFFLRYDHTGDPSFISRRVSVSGDIIDRTEKVPHLAKRIPELANKVFNVELIHTGHDHTEVESPTRVSGLLNALPPRSLEEQRQDGPIRAVIFDVIDPSLKRFKDKIPHIQNLQSHFGDSSLMFAPKYHHGHEAISKLINDTRDEKREGVIVLDHSKEEEKNPRVKIKHVNHYNLKISKILQEIDKHGNPKKSAGAVEVVDAAGQVVGNVGTGFDRKTREDIFENQHEWLGKLIKVKAMKPTASKLRSPVYWGDADGELDSIR